jgi:hypothetical protein
LNVVKEKGFKNKVLYGGKRGKNITAFREWGGV